MQVQKIGPLVPRGPLRGMGGGQKEQVLQVVNLSRAAKINKLEKKKIKIIKIFFLGRVVVFWYLLRLFGTLVQISKEKKKFFF